MGANKRHERKFAAISRKKKVKVCLLILLKTKEIRKLLKPKVSKVPAKPHPYKICLVVHGGAKKTEKMKNAQNSRLARASPYM